MSEFSLQDSLDDEEGRVAAAAAKDMKEGLKEEEEELRVEYKQHNLTVENTIVVFDLHHVLMRPQYKKMAKTLIRHPNKKQLLQVVSSPSVLRRFVNKIGSETPEKSMKDLEEEFGETKFVTGLRNSLSPLIVDICNCQKPDFPTFEVISRIKESGYGVYLLSNIGIEYFLDLRTKMPNQLFDHFDGFYTTNPDDDYVNKPNIKIFHRFLAKFNPESKYKHVVFVDDSVKNVNACEEVGMIGVLYKDSEQMEETLKQIGLQIKSKT